MKFGNAVGHTSDKHLIDQANNKSGLNVDHSNGPKYGEDSPGDYRLDLKMGHQHETETKSLG